MIIRSLLLLLFISCFYINNLTAQVLISKNKIDYSNPKEYEIGGITVSGVKYLDPNVLIHISGLKVGDILYVPGDDITKAIEKLWEQGLFSDINVTATKIQGNKIFLDIYLQERPRLSKFSFTGIAKGEADDLREDIKLIRGTQVTENVIMNTKNIIRSYFVDKGFYNTEVEIIQKDDTVFVNNVILDIKIDKKRKVKIEDIIIDGNEVLVDNKLRRAMKDTKRKKWWRLFKASKFIDGNIEEDKKNLIAKYNEKGYRDAIIVKDTVYEFMGAVKKQPSNYTKSLLPRLIYKWSKKEEKTGQDYNQKKSPKLAKKLERKGYEDVKLFDDYVTFNKGTESKKIRKGPAYFSRALWYNVFQSSGSDVSFKEFNNQRLIDKYTSKKKIESVEIEDNMMYMKRKFKNIVVELKIEEGKKYYFRDIKWVGNTIYPSEYLDAVLGIEEGDVFDQSILDNRLFIEEDALSSLYLDNGYLFFNVNPVEVLVENDSIDMEMQVYEGKQATIDKVIITGNTKTNDHVVRREIRTKPGQLFNRSDIIRTNRELAQLGFFDPEKLDVQPTPDPSNGTVDLEYFVEEKPSDQIELSGGFGGGMVIGTLGLVFNNFSAKNMFNGKAWRPLPSGDGQKLSLRAQTNGQFYQAYSMSFVEPWLGGKKPNSFSVSFFHTIRNAGYNITDQERNMKISGVTLGFGRRLKWPDDFFVLSHSLSYQRYKLKDYAGFFVFSNGTSNNISFETTLSRNSSGPNPIYPTTGSLFSFTVQVTPPYSLFKEDGFFLLSDEEKDEIRNDPDYEEFAEAEIYTRETANRYNWIEYHKWKFKASWFTTIYDKLVLNTKAEIGMIGYYNETVGYSPFETFNVGGDGLSGYDLYGTDVIGLRGYDNGSSNRGSITPRYPLTGNAYNKYTLELRYPFSLSPSATVYGLVFAEGGNAWYELSDINPFNFYRSAGFGVRIFLPMFGMLGVDWGYGFDDIPWSPGSNKGQFAFVIGQQF